MENLTIEEQRVLQEELSSGESLLWTGRPNPRVIFHPSDWYMIPFSLMWGGFAIFWEAGVCGLGLWGQKGSWNFGMVWGIPFVVMGQYMIWGRFLYTAWKKKHVLYALTSERLLTMVRPPQRKIVSMYLKSIPGIDKEIREDGIGTLKFGDTTPSWSSGRRGKSPSPLYLESSIPVFVDIDDAASVAVQIATALKKTTPAEPEPSPSYFRSLS